MLKLPPHSSFVCAVLAKSLEITSEVPHFVPAAHFSWPVRVVKPEANALRLALLSMSMVPIRTVLSLSSCLHRDSHDSRGVYCASDHGALP